MNRATSCLRCRSARLKTHNLLTRAFASEAAPTSKPQPKRPTSAPKPIIDIRHIRQTPDLYEKTCHERNYTRQASYPSRIVALHTQWQALTRGSRANRERSNLLRKQLANPATSSDDGDLEGVRKMSRQEVVEEARRLKQELSGMVDEESRVQSDMEALALEMPNLTSEETPQGSEPALLSYINEERLPNHIEGGALSKPPSADHEASVAQDVVSHVQIGTELGILDFAAAATSSGWGWYYLVGEAAQLEQALIQYALAVVTRHGWTQVSPPTMVYSHIGAACGFQPRDQNGEQQIYTIGQSQADIDRGVPEMCLTGTSEISLAGMKASSTIHTDELPLKRVAVSRCYRAEAGARGADTKGLYRVHEFTKVEMFAWTAPDEDAAQDVFDEMLDMQTEILSSLRLPARVLAMPAPDLGASATRKIDMEAWFPSRAAKLGGWGEVTSASLCTDYQTRRLGTRMRVGGDMGFPYTANGTALAVPRVLAALLENNFDQEKRTVAIPECLRPWMDGKEEIGGGKPRRKNMDGV